VEQSSYANFDKALAQAKAEKKAKKK